MSYEDEEDEENELSGYGYGAQIEEVGADDDDEINDILGAIEIVDDTEVGEDAELGIYQDRPRTSRRSYSRRAVRRQPPVVLRAPRVVRKVLRNVQPTRLHDLPLPIERTLIPSGQQGRVIQLQPQLPFKPYRLSIPSLISGGRDRFHREFTPS